MKKIMKGLIVLVPAAVMTVLLSLPGAGWALTINDYWDTTGSWTQGFLEGGKDFEFDRMEVYMVDDASTFKDTGFEDIVGTASWSSELVTSSSGLSGALATTENPQPKYVPLSFNLHFTTDRYEPFAFEFYAYLKGEQKDFALVTWSGSAWTIEPEDVRLPVPLPGALLLFGTGLVGLAVSRRRRLQG